MRWYLNDISLQGQFNDERSFELLFRQLIAERGQSDLLRSSFRVTRLLPDRLVKTSVSLRAMLLSSRDRDLRGAALSWLDRNGPFVDDDRTDEVDDYFEFESIDVTEGALGEAARRAKMNERVAVFSFSGGVVDFCRAPLLIHHGIPEQRLGHHAVDNVWTIETLRLSVISAGPPISSWKSLVESARTRFPFLVLPNTIYENASLSSEPFNTAIRDRAVEMLSYLNQYLSDRGPNGEEGPIARSLITRFFVGDRARFSGESATNRVHYRNELTFSHPYLDGEKIFAHWHGKISTRYFRLHFEWPLPREAKKLVVCYLGPKITKT
jgi:hypothetical protein